LLAAAHAALTAAPCSMHLTVLMTTFRCAVLPLRTRVQAAKRFSFECERDLIRFCHPANLMDGT
jgi:hypothetical protein